MTDQPTDVAFVLVDLVSEHRAFPDQAARDLHRLLGHPIACPPTGVLRYDRLQLLLRMLLDAAVVPTFDEYEARRQADESDAPAASTLVNAYGHWLSACDAATRFLGNTSAQVAHTHRHSRGYVPYVPREVVDAIARFHGRFGTWPTKWEYSEWGRLERQAARHTGAPTHASRRWDKSPRHSVPTIAPCSSHGTLPHPRYPRGRPVARTRSLPVRLDAARTSPQARCAHMSGSPPDVLVARGVAAARPARSAPPRLSPSASHQRSHLNAFSTRPSCTCRTSRVG